MILTGSGIVGGIRVKGLCILGEIIGLGYSLQTPFLFVLFNLAAIIIYSTFLVGYTQKMVD
jgi:hypothetical protein